MSEERVNNQDSSDSRAAQGFEQVSVPADARPVCPVCLHPCDPLSYYYCPHCDSNEPLNPLASYMPFVRIRFVAGMYGKIWRRIWRKDTSLFATIGLLLLIVLGAPVIIVLGVPLTLIGKIQNPAMRKAATVAFFLLLTALIAYLVLPRKPWIGHFNYPHP